MYRKRMLHKGCKKTAPENDLWKWVGTEEQMKQEADVWVCDYGREEPMGDDIKLRVSKIEKSFPGVKALDKIDFTVRKGTSLH